MSERLRCARDGASQERRISVIGVDLSPRAIALLRASPEYIAPHVHAFVWDAAADEGDEAGRAREPAELAWLAGRVDVVTCIFSLSAMEEARQRLAVRRAGGLLRAGGRLLVRDYAVGDLAQLRQRDGSCLGRHLYCRGDLTLVNYLDVQRLCALMAGEGLARVWCEVESRAGLNRATNTSMPRRWIHAEFCKPLGAQPLCTPCPGTSQK